jgi:glucose/arabinose dehydrogenase
MVIYTSVLAMAVGGGDPNGNAQNPNSLLGKLLWIDIESGVTIPYGIPSSNPYKQTSCYRGEIWALGLATHGVFRLIDRQRSFILPM